MKYKEAEEADDQGDGSYLVTVIDAAEFDASACLCHQICIKKEHVGDGYLHDANDDTPYDVDGVKYCGRCHLAM